MRKKPITITSKCYYSPLPLPQMPAGFNWEWSVPCHGRWSSFQATCGWQGGGNARNQWIHNHMPQVFVGKSLVRNAKMGGAWWIWISRWSEQLESQPRNSRPFISWCTPKLVSHLCCWPELVHRSLCVIGLLFCHELSLALVSCYGPFLEIAVRPMWLHFVSLAVVFVTPASLQSNIRSVP